MRHNMVNQLKTHRLILAFSVATTTLDVNAQVVWDAVIDCNALGQGTLRPRIAMNGDGAPVVLWGDNSPSANYVAIGNGAAFMAPIEVSAPGLVPSVDDWMGSSIATVGNEVWVVMKASPEVSRPLYVRRSDDGGFTWGDTIRVDPFDGLISRFPSIAVGPEGPLVQYMQFDNGWNGARQVVTRMMGGAFMPPVQVSAPFAPGEVCDCCPNQIVTDADRAVALYRNAGPNIRVMWGASSTDGGVTFPVGAEIDTTGWPLNACPSSGPDGYIDGDSIRYVWMSGANNGTKSYIGSALISDLSLGRQRKLQGGQPMAVQQNFPRIAGSGDTLGVVWQQNVGSNQEILFSWSVTGLDGLNAADTVNSVLMGAQATPDIAYANGAFHIVWSESGSDQVRYRKATLMDQTSINEAPVIDVLLSPNPVGDMLKIGGTGRFDVEIVALDGKLMMRRPNINGSVDVSGLPSGAYLCTLRNTTSERTYRFEKF